VGTILSTRLGALLAGALSMGAGSTYRCSRSVSCSSRPQPTRSRSRRLPHLDVDAYELALVWAYEKGQHTRGSTPPPAELLSKVTAIGHLPEHWREVVRIAQGIGQSCTRRSGTCQLSGQHQSYLHLRRHAQRWLPAVHPRRATGRFHQPTDLRHAFPAERVTHGTISGTTVSCRVVMSAAGFGI